MGGEPRPLNLYVQGGALSVCHGNTVADRIAVLIDALDQLAGGVGQHPAAHEVVVRTDSGGAPTHSWRR